MRSEAIVWRSENWGVSVCSATVCTDILFDCLTVMCASMMNSDVLTRFDIYGLVLAHTESVDTY